MAVGDGAFGFWSAVRDAWPETTPQRDWCHKMANVLDNLPKRLRPRAKRALREIMYAATRADAETAIGAFVDEFEAKHPKTTGCLLEDQEGAAGILRDAGRALVAPADVESDRVAVRDGAAAATCDEGGAGSRTKGLLMAYKLLEIAQRRWRRLNGAHVLPLVRAGVRFIDGVPEERAPMENGGSEGSRLNGVKTDPQHLTIARVGAKGYGVHSAVRRSAATARALRYCDTP